MHLIACAHAPRVRACAARAFLRRVCVHAPRVRACAARACIRRVCVRRVCVRPRRRDGFRSCTTKHRKTRVSQAAKYNEKKRFDLVVGIFLSTVERASDGALMVQPGSHLEERRAREQGAVTGGHLHSPEATVSGEAALSRATPITAQPGTAIVFDKDLLHAGAPNLSPAIRCERNIQVPRLAITSFILPIHFPCPLWYVHIQYSTHLYACLFSCADALYYRMRFESPPQDSPLLEATPPP